MNALVDAAHDKDANVRRDIMRSLCELGKKQPLLVLSICSCYLNKHQKVCIVVPFTFLGTYFLLYDLMLGKLLILNNVGMIYKQHMAKILKCELIAI